MNMNKYKWWDYYFLLQAMEDWLEYSSEMHKSKGMSVSSEDTAKKMEFAASLIKRIRQGDVYYNDNNVFYSKGVDKYSPSDAKRKQDIEYLFDYLKKHLTNFWD